MAESSKNIKEKLAERLTNELYDKLKGLEMDVTDSFLTGKICSPLLSSASQAMTYAQTNVGGAINAAASAGLYITKDGLQFDPTVVTSAAGNIVNSAMNLAMDEVIRLKDVAIREITYIPDPSIIMKKALSYFSYNVQHNIDLNSLLTDLNISSDDKEEEQEEEEPEKTKNALQTFVDEKLPTINDKISDISSTVNRVTSYATQYMSFGPDWIIEKVSYNIGEASRFADRYLAEQTAKVNNWKMAQYDKAAYTIATTLTKKYESLIKSDLKGMQDDIKVEKEGAVAKAKSLLQKANLAIMAKTGIKIPIDKLTPENLAKVKQMNKKSALVQLASSAITSNGPDNSNEKPTNKEETTKEETTEHTSDNTQQTYDDGRYAKYSEEYIGKLFAGLEKLYDYSLKYEFKCQERYNKTFDDDDYDAWDAARDKSNEVNKMLSEVKLYIKEGVKLFEERAKLRAQSKDGKLFGERFGGHAADNIDELVKQALDLLNSSPCYNKNDDEFIWDSTEMDYVQNITLDELVVTAPANNTNSSSDENEEIDLYVQTFMNTTI